MTESSKNTLILGMILLEQANSLELHKVISELRNTWNLEVDDKESDNGTAVLIVEGYTIAIAEIPAPIPGEEIKDAAQVNYFWKNAPEEAPNHKAHIILSIVDAGKEPVTENLLYCKVATSVLKNCEASGIYLGGRTLLLKKSFYLANTEIIIEEGLPLYNWIFFGLRRENGRQSVYTYGLKDFNKQEMEIINSTHSLGELTDIMYNFIHYILEYDVELKSGETIGLSAEQKLEIVESEGHFLEGKTLKIIY